MGGFLDLSRGGCAVDHTRTQEAPWLLLGPEAKPVCCVVGTDRHSDRGKFLKLQAK